HLRPPNGLCDIEFHRFSPYFNDPEGFGIRLRPHGKYSFIYPFDEETIARLAYVFELEGRTPMDLTYLRRMNEAVNRWRMDYTIDKCALTWSADDPDILIQDRRPGFGPRDYRLQDHAIAAFEALDQPKPLRVAVQESLASTGPDPDRNESEGSWSEGPAGGFRHKPLTILQPAGTHVP